MTCRIVAERQIEPGVWVDCSDKEASQFTILDDTDHMLGAYLSLREAKHRADEINRTVRWVLPNVDGTAERWPTGQQGALYDPRNVTAAFRSINEAWDRADNARVLANRPLHNADGTSYSAAVQNVPTPSFVVRDMRLDEDAQQALERLARGDEQ